MEENNKEKSNEKLKHRVIEKSRRRERTFYCGEYKKWKRKKENKKGTRKNNKSRRNEVKRTPA